MTSDDFSDSADGADSPALDPGGLRQAIRAVLQPLARLAVSRGLRHGELDEMLKMLLIDAARQAHAHIPAQRSVSRISTATGLSRREVTRLLQDEPEQRSKRPSAISQVFARWTSDPALRMPGGGPRPLPRLGPAPSFENLAQSVNKDVRPRTLLDELCRLGLARIHEADDTVELLRDTFVPANDEAQMFGFLGDNVGDHLRATVDNVTSPGVRHLEQAIFADGLSVRSVEELRPQVHLQWKALVNALSPLLQALIDEDASAGRPQDHRVRVGLYFYNAPMAEVALPGEPPAADKPPE